MGPVILAILMEVTAPQPSGPNIFQALGMIGGLLGIVALVSLPWTIKKLSAETKSLEVTTEVGASELALKHLKAALEEADKTVQRMRDDQKALVEEYKAKIVGLEQQMHRLGETLDEERRKSERERELYEKRIVQLLYDLHAKDLEIAGLRHGRNGPASSPNQAL